jgi:hypothetical protein
VLHPGRVERRPPSALVGAGELQIVALARHADRDPPDASPGVEPGPKWMNDLATSFRSTASIGLRV